MAKLDGYLRSIEKFGAAGAVLASGQAVTLRFPTGDRHATQVTPHDQLVGLVREVAPPAVLDQIDKNRPGRFEHESNGIRYAVSIAPRPGAWQVAIAAITEPAEPVRAAVAPLAAAVAAQAPAAPDQAIERGQYDSAAVQRIPASGSVLLDDLTRIARTAQATDVYLATAAQPMQRANGELTLIGSAALDGDSLSRELGIVAPADARATWLEHGGAVFAYGDGGGRVRATLTRDHRGPSAALRLLPDEAPSLDLMNLSIDDWLQGEGLVVIAGPSGSGKTVALAAIVRALADRRRRAISIEDPIEIVHVSPWISQREVGSHVASVAAGVASAMLEGADAIAVGSVTSSDSASAVVDAVAGGHFVVMTIVAPVAGVAPLERVIDLLPVDRRELARGICATALLGTICPVSTRGGRTFEITRASRSV